MDLFCYFDSIMFTKFKGHWKSLKQKENPEQWQYFTNNTCEDPDFSSDFLFKEKG